MGPAVPFSSPPLRLYARTAGIEIGDDWPSWAAPALWNTAPGSSPFKAVGSLVKHRDELTKSSERVLRHSAVSLLTDGLLPWLLEVDDACSSLKMVAAKVETRAAKRSAEAEAAAEAERRVSERVGAARKAFREKVAARPVKMRRIVSMTGRVGVF